MSSNRPKNHFERQFHKKALEKKERAKAKRFGWGPKQQGGDRTEVESWDEIAQINPSENTVLCILVEIRGGIFKVLYGDDILDCHLGKHIPFQLGKGLSVGDRVFVQTSEENNTIMACHERTNFIARMRRDSTRFSSFQIDEQIVAVNIDVGVIVASIIHPDFHPNFIDRYLIIMQNGGVNPLICLNKCDLTSDRPNILDYYRDQLHIEVIEISATTGLGIEKLQDALKDKLAVLVGNSGVGKTSIINALYGQNRLKTQDISGKRKEGRHTTTTTTLHTWDKKSYIIDTPGIRSLEVDHIDKNELKLFFPEFQEFEKECKYRNCIHEHEGLSDCAVKRAVENGNINRTRYESYIRMLADLV